MSELVVQVDDISILPDIEKAISMLKGVVSVRLRRKQKKNALFREKEEIKADLRQGIEELKLAREGKIQLQSADDFLKELREA